MVHSLNTSSSCDSFFGQTIKLGKRERDTNMAKTAKKKAKPVRKAKAKTAAKRSGSARRKMTAKRSTARKSKARRKAA